MSWLNRAFSKAAEAGGKNLGPNLSKTVRTYAGSVYQQANQAVAGGAKIVQDRLSGRNLNNFKHAVRRLDEVALIARGEERKLALARWLGALKDIEKESQNPLNRTESLSSQSDESASPSTSNEEDPGFSPRRASMVLFFDADTGGGEPLNFRDVFLRSHAVENIVTSMILEAPSAEEVSMLLELFALCLTGGPELHHAIVSSIQELAKAAAIYSDEVLIKKEEFLQMARDAVSGLKLNPEVERLDAEIDTLHHQMSEKEGTEGVIDESLNTQSPTPTSSLEPNPTESILMLQVRLRQCLQKKSLAQWGGDSPKDRAFKVQRLKELTVNLNSSSEEIQKQLLENKQQKEEAMNYRVTKAQEVTEVEKVVTGEVRELDKRRQELEDELREVKASLAAATARHIHTQEEKEQFDEASSNIIAHLSVKDDEMSRSVSARTAEGHVVKTWVNFLEDTWVLQAASVEKTVKETEDAWAKSKLHFFQVASISLSQQQEETDTLLKKLRFCAEEFKMLKQKRANVAELGKDEGVNADITKAMRNTQSSYIETEAQVEKLLTWAGRLEDEARVYQSTQDEEKSEAESKLVQGFDAVALLRKDFESLERPEIEVEKIEKRAIQQGRAIFERARSQVIETGEKLRAATKKDDSSKDNSIGEVTENENESIETKESPTESPPSEDPDDDKDSENLAVHGETEGWEFDELEEDAATESKNK